MAFGEKLRTSGRPTASKVKYPGTKPGILESEGGAIPLEVP